MADLTEIYTSEQNVSINNDFRESEESIITTPRPSRASGHYETDKFISIENMSLDTYTSKIIEEVSQVLQKDENLSKLHVSFSYVDAGTFCAIDRPQKRVFGLSSPPNIVIDPATVRQFSFIKEKPSVDAAEILEVKQNIIKMNSTEDVEVRHTANLAKEHWEVAEGLMISSLLKRAPYAPYGSREPLISISENRRPDEFGTDLKLLISNKNDSCDEFLSPLSAGNLLVANVIQQATEGKRKILSLYGDPERKRVIIPASPLKMPVSTWPTIKKFTPEEGLFYIENYIIETNQFEENWKYSIKFQKGQSDRVSDHYFYNAKFCLPNKLYPIPQVTVCIFFYIEVSRVIPKQCPVKVLLRLETSHRKMDPNEFVLNDNVLTKILDLKLHNFKTFTF